MTIYSFHLFDRNCESIITRHFHPPSHSLSVDDLNKLIFGTVYSLHSTIKKLSPCEAKSQFVIRTSGYALHLYETLTLLRFILVTSPDFPANESPTSIGASTILKQIYQSLYIEYLIKNPLSQECLYTPAQITFVKERKFGVAGQQSKVQLKRQKELERREQEIGGGSTRGLNMVVGCELFVLALDQFVGSLPGYD